jgi:phthalate 4,5-dioxygenase
VLSREDNERLVRVGPGTPAGRLFRRYWLPALLASEIPEPDGAPVRVRMLGEDLLAFRDSSGRAALVDAFCAHRRAPLFFGRNEADGIRCAYHGWKFDLTGACVDIPSEPATSNMKSRIRLKAYPAVERGGVIWAYMGPRESMPEPPDYEWTRAPEAHRHVSKTLEHCNYLQALEGGLDTAHSSFLHNNRLGDRTQLRQRDTAPRIDVEPTDYGYYYVSHRKAGADGSYVRVYQYVMPSQQMRGAVGALREERDLPRLDGHIWVPIDDEHTHVYNWMCGYDRTVSFSEEFREQAESYFGRGTKDLVPGTFRLKKNLSNDYEVDRQKQKTQSYTGIDGINTQDFALQEGMGPIVDRSQENLGTSDKAIVTMRRLMLEAVDAVERGDDPRGLHPASYRGVRPYDGLVPPEANWREVFGRELEAKW